MHFLIHVVLSIVKHKTEIDTLHNAFFRDILREVKHICSATEDISLRIFFEILTRDCVENQILYYPNSMNRSETFIVMSKRIFDNTIIHTSISMNELPPCTMKNLRI